MSYPGNRALAANVQERILGTFEQTLDLAAEGNRQEALLGCDFVLRMDPLFEPARRLQERLAAGNGAAGVDDLRRGAFAVVEESADDIFGDLDDLDFELPELPPAESDLAVELQALLDARRFDELLRVAERESATVMAQPQLRGLVETAQARLEAEPYVERFLAAARQARAEGRHGEIDKLLAKARSLDPGHPGIAEIEGIPAIAESGTPPLFEPEAAEPAFPSLELPHPAAGLFDAPAAPGGDSESERRIAELLDEGQRAFDRGDHQAAVDAWSRIFLIDIDHQEAARRIEQARRLRAEHEREVEEIFHDGLASLEAGDVAAARERFERALELQPGHFAAREHLQQLEAGGPPPRAAAATGAGFSGPALSLPDLDDDAGILKEEILVPPEPGQAPSRMSRAAERPALAATRQSRPGRTFALIGGLVLVLVGAAVWFLMSNWDRLFPNSTSADELAATTPPTTTADPVAAASKLHEQGKTALALSRLKRLRPDHPRYADAQALIAQWEAASPVAAATGPPPEQAALRDRLLEAARRAQAEGDALRALERFERAAAIAPLAAGDAELRAATERQLEPLARQIEYFRQHEWDLLLPELWRLREQDPGNPVVQRLMVDSYYNLAVQDLVRGDAGNAVDKLEQALELAPQDGTLRRHFLFAQTYRGRPQDLQYRIYVKHLPTR